MKKVIGFIYKVWCYFKSSWEDDHGSFSYRRFTQFIFTWLIIDMVIKNKVQSQWGYYTFLTIVGAFLLVAALITAQQLIILLKRPLGGFGFNGDQSQDSQDSQDQDDNDGSDQQDQPEQNQDDNGERKPPINADQVDNKDKDSN